MWNETASQGNAHNMGLAGIPLKAQLGAQSAPRPTPIMDRAQQVCASSSAVRAQLDALLRDLRPSQPNAKDCGNAATSVSLDNLLDSASADLSAVTYILAELRTYLLG